MYFCVFLLVKLGGGAGLEPAYQLRWTGSYLLDHPPHCKLFGLFQFFLEYSLLHLHFLPTIGAVF